MKKLVIKQIILLLLIGGLTIQLFGQEVTYWNSNLLINSYRLPLPSIGTKPEYIDLDKDGDPDVLRSYISNGIPIQWIDDDDDMKVGDFEGDIDSDCLMIDRDKNGEYGGYGDLVIDWIDTDKDGIADMQVVVDNVSEAELKDKYSGHYMWMIDTDMDNILNYIDWHTLSLRCWIHDGQSDFFEDYSGKSAFLKIHCTPDRMNDPKLSWENPFLFYDPDEDGLTEMAIRFLDEYIPNPESKVNASLSGEITYVSISADLDNDNAPGQEFDFDFTLGFNGGGFDYLDQIHHFENLREKEADQYFLDKRWRQLSELIYPGHDSAWELIFKRGRWESVRFVYDEDDDCNRWERVEFYDPLDPFKIGAKNGGLDNNRQSDASGDRGEWDADNSGNGKLYISHFDGRLHLYGAEWGAWRIDQNAWSFQGMGGIYDGYGPGRAQIPPTKIATIKYADTDQNGFFDQLQYDLDGDTIFEMEVNLIDLGINDRCDLIDISEFKYGDLFLLKSRMAEQMWINAQNVLSIAKKYGIQTKWYSLLMNPKSIRQKYHHGFWLQFYLFNDLIYYFKYQNNQQKIKEITKAYYSGSWTMLLE